MPEWVTDGGLETDLLFHRGVELPDFAAFPLVEDERARLLREYYVDYVSIAAAAGAGVVLETPTWRANPDWGARLGYDAAALDRVNRAAVELVRAVDTDGVPLRISGVVGPRGDGYVPGGRRADEAAAYHHAQCASFAAAGADVVHAMTISEPAEAVGVVRAARDAGLPVGISFTVETDGRLPDGTALGDAVRQVDEVAPPDWYGVNCAHPTHVVAGAGRRNVAGTAPGVPAERLDADARGTRRHGGARRGRPGPALRKYLDIAGPAAVGGHARRLLRHGRLPRRGPVGAAPARAVRGEFGGGTAVAVTRRGDGHGSRALVRRLPGELGHLLGVGHELTRPQRQGEVHDGEHRGEHEAPLEARGERVRGRTAGREPGRHLGRRQRADHGEPEGAPHLVAGVDDARDGAGVLVADVRGGDHLGGHADAGDAGAEGTETGEQVGDVAAGAPALDSRSRPTTLRAADAACTGRVPMRESSCEATSAAAMAAKPIGRNSRPVSSAESPRTCCR